MKLGFILEPKAVNSNYRVVFPMQALERRGHEVVWPRDLTADIPMQELLRCDLVHCFRRLDRARDLKLLSQRGVAVSFDNDDDLAAVEVSSTGTGRIETGPKGLLDNRKKFAEIKRMTRLADLATTPSQRLAEKYREAGASHVAVIENHLSRGMAGFGTRVEHEGVVVGWVASKEHEVDLPQLTLIDALRTLLDRHANLRILSVGSRLPLESERYEYRKPVLFDELLSVTAGIDIGVAPLANTQFNRSRSNIKLKEYASGGATWLASPIGAYAAMGTREGGSLVSDDGWLAALDGLLSSRFKRRRLARQASKWAESQVIDKFSSTWETEFSMAVDRARERMLQPRASAAQQM